MSKLRRGSYHQAMAAVAITAFLFAGSVDARIYRWVDENGKVQFSDKPPPGATMKQDDVISDLQPAATETGQTVETPQPAATVTDQTSTEQVPEAPASEPQQAPQTQATQPTAAGTDKVVENDVLPSTGNNADTSASLQRAKKLQRKHERCAKARNRLDQTVIKWNKRQQRATPEETRRYYLQLIEKRQADVNASCG
ncbi:DUF4124 domain-containing protein [Pseudomaricurvus alkylphenolicus]|uniref:DUF4124 domain-containing protein n=1 Tax=Pseudomaricurvus alkylphenolicus TaxID=1306991 RepID=UPI00141DFE8E|nr:DUF4124 domain-containing protein [Pseudomaricurvus alkylphenolicus]NIB43052.1 DUF4124 domain-containing protein [Pseudomaricurvus alkylphenolicus]